MVKYSELSFGIDMLLFLTFLRVDRELFECRVRTYFKSEDKSLYLI